MNREQSARRRQRERTRARILGVAAELFAARGFASTTTLEVARAAGVSHGTVFAHFASRERLLTEVIEGFGSRMAARTHDLTRGGAGLRAVLEAHLASIAEQEAFYARLVTEAAALPVEARQVLIGIDSALSLHLSGAAERGESGGAARSIPMHLLFNTWIALVHYYLANRELFAPGGSVVSRCGQELVDHYMGLVAPRGGST
jgi:AcrR family transcriptional regulator